MPRTALLLCRESNIARGHVGLDTLLPPVVLLDRLRLGGSVAAGGGGAGARSASGGVRPGAAGGGGSSSSSNSGAGSVGNTSGVGGGPSSAALAADKAQIPVVVRDALRRMLLPNPSDRYVERACAPHLPMQDK